MITRARCCVRLRAARADKPPSRDADARHRDLRLHGRSRPVPRALHHGQVKHYVAPPNHDSNEKLQDAWLSED